MDVSPLVTHFPFHEVALKVALSSGIGLLVGLEREWSHKEIGVRTFAITGLLGMLTSLLAPAYVISALGAIVVLVAFLNIHSLLKDRSLELTTSLCLIVVFFLGVLVGLGHTFTASTSAIAMMMLLAWKLELERFAGALRPDEIRSAVLLGLLSVVIYPLLPDRFVDPWQLFNPRQFWVTVVVIAGIGFLNYVLLRLYSTRGLYYAAVLGGLVNSTAAVAELSAQFRNRISLASRAVPVLLLTNLSMFVRNGVILFVFAPKAVATAAWPLGGMAGAAALFAWLKHGKADDGPSDPLQLSSPVSVVRLARFSVVFLALGCAGTLGQRFLGDFGFLVVSLLGGMVSSASTTAAAAALAASGRISPATAGIATTLTSITSALVNIPVVYQQTKQKALTRNLSVISVLIVALGVAIMMVMHIAHRRH